MITWLYTFFIKLYSTAVRVAAILGNTKAKSAVDGRKNWLFRLQKACASIPTGKRIWIHCSSLGEFEQVRTVLDELYDNGNKIVLSFFSPSGYLQRSNYSKADLICYLPWDTTSNVEDFLNCVRPDLAIFVKYDLWWNYLNGLKKRNIPSILIAAYTNTLLWRNFKKWWYSKNYKLIQTIFTQDQSTKDILAESNIHSIVAGDPRIDRSILLPFEWEIRIPEKIKLWSQDSQILIFGSIWETDKYLMLQLINHAELQSWKFIIAPHDVSNSSINMWTEVIGENLELWSKELQTIDNPRCLLIDHIGSLAFSYALADLVYIGGGFGKGIHNTLEPAAFSKPVFIGPKHKKFIEAMELVQSGGFFCIQNSSDFIKYFNQLQTKTNYKKASKSVEDFMQKHVGATKMIVKIIKESLN